MDCESTDDDLDLPSEGSIPTLRTRLEEIDENIVQLLAHRLSLAKRVGEKKRSLEEYDPVDPAQANTVLDRSEMLAEEHNLDPDSVRDIFTKIIDLSERSQGLSKQHRTATSSKSTPDE